MSIVQGDHGYAIPFIARKDIILDLTGASVEVAIERGGEIINKQASILDPLTGKCEVVLSSKDLRLIGKYTYQWTAFLADGRILSGDPIDFFVKDKLRDLPFGDGEETKVVPFASQEDLDALKEYVDGIVITGGGSVVTDGDTNGTIKVNNVEVLVYDESGILQRIQALEEAPSGGSGSAVTDSTINGNISVDGQEIKVYDDAAVNEQLADMVRSVNGVLPDVNGNVSVSTGGGGTLPSNVILFEDWLGGESVTIDTGTVEPPADTTDPVLSITAGGTFTGTKSVTMSTDETATIYYTLDGSTPTTSSAVYSSALSISATTTLKAFAVDTAGNSSAIQTVTYTLEEVDTTDPVVTASPVAGTYTSAQEITLSADETATIYYTLDGSTPTTSSLVYGAPINIDTTTTIQFMAVDTAGNQSTPVAATYTIDIPKDTTAPVLTITPAATFTDSITVTMSTDETATIWYTLDDTDPITSATRMEYTTAITLTETDTVKAYAVDIAGNASVVQTVTYTKEVQTPSEVTTTNMILYLDGAVDSTHIVPGTAGGTAYWKDKSGKSNDLTMPAIGESIIPTGVFHDGVFENIYGNGIDSRTLPFNNFNDYPMSWEFIVKFPPSIASELIKIGASNPNYTMKYRGDIITTSPKGRLLLTKAGTGGNYIEIDVPSETDLAGFVHIVYVVEPNNLAVYLNGVLLQSVTTTMPIIADDLTGGKADFQFIANALQTKVVRAYSRALTTTEIQNNYNAQSALY